MMMVPMPAKGHLAENRVLAALPDVERELLAPFFEDVELHLGEVLNNGGEPIGFLYFPLDAAISMVDAHIEEQMTDVALTGREGCCGSFIVQGSNRAPCLAMVELAGHAVRVPVSAITEHLPRMPYLRAALDRYNLLLTRHIAIAVGCAKYHSPAQQVTRWMMSHFHRTDMRAFPFSNEFLAAQAGVDRETVAQVLNELQSQGIVQTTHNNLVIADSSALADRCCPCLALEKGTTDEYAQSLTELSHTHSGV
jgi:hypothetical protein